jgi:hypothetical protein
VPQLARCPRAVDADDSHCCAESRARWRRPAACRRRWRTPARCSSLCAAAGRRARRRGSRAGAASAGVIRRLPGRSPIGPTTSIRAHNVVGLPEPLSSGGLGGAALQEGGLWASGYVQPVAHKAGGQRAVSHGGPHPFQRVCANVAGGEDAGLAGLQRVGAAA